MHASGTSAPRGDGGENGLSSGTSGPIASRDDGAVLIAAKTYQDSVRQGFLLTLRVLLRTQDMILFQHRVRRNEQTERVCAENASLIPIRRATNTSRPRDNGHTCTDAATRPHPRAHTRTPGRPKTTTTVFLLGFLKGLLSNFFEGTTVKAPPCTRRRMMSGALRKEG